MISRRTACTALVASLAATAAYADPAVRVIVLGVEEVGVTGKDIAKLPEVISQYVATHPGFEAVPEMDMRLAVGATGKSQRTCLASRACLDEVGKATHSDFVLSTSVTSLPSGFVVEMSRIEVNSTAPPKSAVEKTEHRSEIPQHVRQCVDRLFTWTEGVRKPPPEVAAKAPTPAAQAPASASEPETTEPQPSFIAPAPAAPEPTTPAPLTALVPPSPAVESPATLPPPLPPPAPVAMPWQRIAGWIGIAVGGAALATGVGLGVSSRALQNEIHTSARSGATALQLMQTSNGNAIGADVALIGGGVLGAGGVALVVVF